MARTADAVVIEVEARLNKASSRAAEAEFDTTVNRMAASAGRAEQVITQSSGKMTASFSRMGGEAGKFTQTMSAMARPVTYSAGALATLGTQATQAAGAMAKTGAAAGVVGRAAGLMGSLLGGVVASGVALLAIALVGLVTKLFESEEGVGDLVKKLQEKYDQTQRNEQADRIWAQTIDGLTAALRKQREETDKLVTSQKQQEAQAVSTREALLASLTAQRDALVTRVRATMASEPEIGTGTTASEADAQRRRYIAWEQHLRKMTADLNNLNTQIASAQGEVARRVAVQSTETAERAGDAIKEITDRYEDQIKAAQNIAGTMTQFWAKTAEERAQVRSDTDKTIAALVKQRDIELAIARERARKTPKAKADDLDLVPFQRPVAGGRTTGAFGEQRGNRSHAGLDIAVPVGTPVSAAAGGVVIESGTIPGYGSVVVIDHGRGTITRYAHLSQRGAAKGDVVEAGQQIGLSGGARGAPGAGNSRGPHLHYEVRQGGRAVDPTRAAYAADPMGNSAKAQQLLAQRDRDDAKRQAQVDRFNAEMVDLQGDIVAATRGRVETIDEQLAIDVESVEAAGREREASYKAAEAQGRITEAQMLLLVAKNAEATAAQVNAVHERDRQQRVETQMQLTQQRQGYLIDQLQFEEQNARTADERRAAQQRLLEAELELRRLVLLEQLAKAKVGSVEEQRAQLALQNLEAERARGTARINSDPNNMSPGQAYRAELNQTAGQIDEAIGRAAVDGLRGLNNDLAAAIMGTMSLGEAFDNMANTIIQALVKIAIQQAIIKPLSDLLFGAGASAGAGAAAGLMPVGGAGGGWLGGIVSAIGSLFGRGRARGGTVSAGGAYWVGENGPEPFFPSVAGSIIPNDAVVARGGSGGGDAPNVYSFTVNAPGATAETVAMIRRELRGAAPTIIAAAQRSTIGQLTRRRT